MEQSRSDIIHKIDKLDDEEYFKFLKDFVSWHVENQATKDLREHLFYYLKQVLPDDDYIHWTLDRMNADDVQKSCFHAFNEKLRKMERDDVVDEMLTWGYPITDTEHEDETKPVYLLIKLTVDKGIDVQDMVNEMDYVMTYDGLLASEILDFKSVRNGESPVLYFI